LRKTLDSYVTVGLEVEDVFDNNDHNYFKVDADTCVLYYICGCIIRYFMKHINCKVCQKAIVGKYNLYQHKYTLKLINRNLK